MPVNGTDGKYEISNKGKVKSHYFHGRLRSNPKILKPGLSHGYWSVVFCINGKRRTAFIHRLIAENFMPNPLKRKVINHKDGNRGNNDLNNLEWCTHQHNSQHWVDSLSTTYKNPNSKFSEDDIRSIIAMRFSNKRTAKDIANEMNVTEAAIINICAGRRYKKEYSKIMAHDYGINEPL